MERVYLDSATAIYYVEYRAPWYAAILTRLTTNPVQLVVSDLTRMECRVKPLRHNDAVLLAAFDKLFMSGQVIPLTPAVCDRAADIRARYGYKTPDALHLAAAVESKCDVFLTNDHRLSAFPGVPVEVI